MKTTFKLIIIIPLLFSCAKKKTTKDLYSECKNSSSYYKSKDTIYSPKGGSPHGDFKLKFNSSAVNNLDASGKLPAGASFDKGAVIVKEVFLNGQLSLYAVMKKDPTSKFAASKWVWAELRPDGSVIYDISKRGEGCVSCHGASSNRDMTLSFDLH